MIIPATSKEQAYSRSFYYKETSNIILYPEYKTGLYATVSQNIDNVSIDDDTLDVIIGNLSLQKSKQENHWFTMIKIN